MNRREFLKMSGLASAGLIAAGIPFASKLVESQPHAGPSGKLYRGTHDGKVFVSADQGRSWNLHSNLGKECSILGFSTKSNGQMAAHLSYQYRRFDIRLSKNEKYWLTA